MRRLKEMPPPYWLMKATFMGDLMKSRDTLHRPEVTSIVGPFDMGRLAPV
jgi:hypothetical protein